MKRLICMVTTVLATLAPCTAQVIVNGIADGDVDGASPFETTQAAVKYAITNNEPVVEIQTDTPTGGVSIVPEADYLQGPLTIRAGAGFDPVYTSPWTINPATPDQLVTVENITIDLPPASSGSALYAAGNITLNGCTIQALHQGGGFYPIAIRCNLRSPASDGVLTVNNCYLAAINGIMAGHSIKEYNVTSSTLIGITSDIDWASASPVANIMNWEVNDFGALTNLIDSNTTITVATNPAGDTEVVTLAPIAEPRELNLTQTICRSNGPQLAWPPYSLEGYGDTYYGAANDNTIGPVTAVNCVFDGCNPAVIGSRLLQGTQHPDSTFTHCTFRTSYGITGAVRLRGNETATHTFNNCLFDSPAGTYGIGVDASTQGNITVAGNGNIYCITPGVEYVTLTDDVVPAVVSSLTAFESVYDYSPPVPGGGYITLPDGAMYLPYGKDLAGGKAATITSPLSTDMWGNSRPLPVGATNPDVGAVEFDETVSVLEAVTFDSSNPAGTNAFETADEAIDYAIANSLDTVEIQVNNPTGGFSILPAENYLNSPLTIKPSPGMNPVFTHAVTINPANPGTTVTLNNIDVNLAPDSNGAAVYAAGAIVMNNCNIEANDVGQGHHPVGIACNIRSPGSNGTLVLNSCLVTGHNAVVAGHSIKNHILNDTTILGLTSDLPWGLTATVVNLMNWETNEGGGLTNLIDSNITITVADGLGGTDEVQLTSIQEPRELVMNRCILRSNGELLAWPPPTLEFNGNYYYGSVNDSTVGPVTATNCVFDGCNPLIIGSPYLFDTQSHDSTFTHCTFRTTYGVTGAIRLHSIDPGTYTFNNCLFDSPEGLYGIGVDEAAGNNTVLEGDGNVYCIEPDTETVTIMTSDTLEIGPARPAFEDTTYTYAPPADPVSFLTNPDGTMLLPLGKNLTGGKAVALTPAVTTDIFNNDRPIPVSATSFDVGAVEFDETPASHVRDWLLY